MILVLLVAVAVALSWSPGVAAGPLDAPALPTAAVSPSAEPALVRRHRVLLSGLAAMAGVAFGPATWGWIAGLVLGCLVWRAAGRSESPADLRARDQARRELPHVVRLLSLILAGGAGIHTSLAEVRRALPGPATSELAGAENALLLGVPPQRVWTDLARQPGFEGVARAFLRADRSGSPVADVLARLADDLAREVALVAEDRARAVGARAAVPLGLCLLPAFLVIGIVPVVATAVGAVAW